MEISNTFDQIVSADKSATVFLNNDMGTAADTLFWGLSSRLIWVPVAIYFLYLIVVKRNYDWVMKAAIVLGLVITITLCDQITSSIFKPLVMRFRPSHDIEICAMLHYVNNYHGGNYGFMSSHAANAFGAAMLGAEIIRKRYFTIFLFSLATLVSYSRIYLGVHFLGDVVCGAIVGITIAIIIHHLLKLLHGWLAFRSMRNTWMIKPEEAMVAA